MAKMKRYLKQRMTKQCCGLTCGSHDEQQESGGVERLSCHDEGPGVGVGAHRLGCPAEGKHQTQSSGAHSHQRGHNCKNSLSLHSWRTQDSGHTGNNEKGKQHILMFTLDSDSCIFTQIKQQSIVRASAPLKKKKKK